MKITSLRVMAFALVAVIMSFIGSTTASAQNVSIRIGTPPPPMIVERPWAPPYRGAVWIPGHHEWINGRWVWIGGSYSYPPRRGGYWAPPRYRHGYYYPGHWSYR
jgi:hypothetical protein